MMKTISGSKIQTATTTATTKNDSNGIKIFKNNNDNNTKSTNRNQSPPKIIVNGDSVGMSTIKMKSIMGTTTTTTATAPTLTIPVKGSTLQSGINKSTGPVTCSGTGGNGTGTGLPMAKKSISSMSDDEILQQNLKELFEKKSREERKANGRLVAVIVAFLVIFLAVYHAWIRKTAALAGVLVPAVIMLSYGAWVIILAKRDKHKRRLFERHIEEVSLKNKAELEQKHARLKYDKATSSSSQSSSSNNGGTKLHYENEIKDGTGTAKTEMGNEHRKKPRRQRQRNPKNTISNGQVEVTVHCSALGRRPSIREKLFGQTISHMKLLDVRTVDKNDRNRDRNDEVISNEQTNLSLIQKRKRLQRLDTLPMPQVVRMGSAP